MTALLLTPVVHIDQIDRRDLNRLLVRWGHRMGPYARPSYAIEAHHALFERGEPVAVTASGETVREVIGDTGVRRQDCVELARLCAARPDLCRPMLRLWREMLFPEIARLNHRQIAVSYQDRTLHSGDVYRFDGWLRFARAGGGGRDSRTGRRGRVMSVWGWPRDLTERLAAEGAAARAAASATGRPANPTTADLFEEVA